MKIAIKLLGIEPATFLLVAQCLNKLPNCATGCPICIYRTSIKHAAVCSLAGMRRQIRGEVVVSNCCTVSGLHCNVELLTADYLTPWIWTLLEQLGVPQLVKKSPASYTGVGVSPVPAQEGNKLQRQKILIFIYPIYSHNWRNISTIYIYIYIYMKQEEHQMKYSHHQTKYIGN
jgi:hypothetical protein